MSQSAGKLLVIRIQGGVDASRDEIETLKLLRLHHNFHATILPDNAVVKGMLQKVKDFVTWGEASEQAVEDLLEKRGMLEGGTRLSEDNVKEVLRFESIKALAKCLIKVDRQITSFRPLKPVFRLHPPRGGFRGSTKRSVKESGELGYRGDGITALISKMI